MSLPAGVSRYKDHGRKVPVTQRGWWTNMLMPSGKMERHFTSCMLAALAMILERIGFSVPLMRGEHDYDGTRPRVENMVLALHKATGRPLYSGTTLQDSQNAIADLFPDEDLPIFYGTMTEAEIKTTLWNQGIIRFSARPLTGMPRAWDLPAGYKGSGHAFVSNRRARICAGAGDGVADAGYHEAHKGKNVREIYLVDPMLRPNAEPKYTGQWVPLAKFLEFCDRDDDGEFIVTWGFKSAAIA